MKVFLYYIGKPKDPHANALAADYIARANRFTSSSMAEIRPDRTDLWVKHPTAKKILLDPAGRTLDSAAFADLFAKAEMAGQDLSRGDGLDGFPQAHVVGDQRSPGAHGKQRPLGLIRIQWSLQQIYQPGGGPVAGEQFRELCAAPFRVAPPGDEVQRIIIDAQFVTGLRRQLQERFQHVEAVFRQQAFLSGIE